MTQRNEMPEELYALTPTEDEPDKSYLTKPELIKGLVESDKEMGAMGALYIRADLAEELKRENEMLRLAAKPLYSRRQLERRLEAAEGLAGYFGELIEFYEHYAPNKDKLPIYRAALAKFNEGK